MTSNVNNAAISEIFHIIDFLVRVVLEDTEQFLLLLYLSKLFQFILYRNMLQ